MIKIRFAQPRDAETLVNIYAPYVEKTAFSFETEAPSKEEFAQRIKTISSEFPYLVAYEGEKIVGYAYASHHRTRSAYIHSADTSIYVAPDFQGQDVARQLYDHLFQILIKQGIYCVYAGVGEPNPRSGGFHLKYGFSKVGTFHNSGYKNSGWHDVTYYEYQLRPLDDQPQSFTPFSKL